MKATIKYDPDEARELQHALAFVEPQLAGRMNALVCELREAIIRTVDVAGMKIELSGGRHHEQGHEDANSDTDLRG